jgi:hypothetical protein
MLLIVGCGDDRLARIPAAPVYQAVYRLIS